MYINLLLRSYYNYKFTEYNNYNAYELCTPMLAYAHMFSVTYDA